jgi:cysteinyl-tRNA synthetase
MLKIYNTLHRKIEDFVSLKEGRAGLYACGPTVYNFAHIGNFRTYIFEDVLRRVLQYNNLKVKHVVNITDVGHLASDADLGEDKVLSRARAEGKSAWDIAAFYEAAFKKDWKRLNLLPPTKWARATAHIKDQIKLIEVLEKRGFTYKIADGIYFDTAKFSDYGKLSGQKLEEKEAGARVAKNPEKRRPWDFALWKFSPAGAKREMEWPSPWGKGFPGWHIECSAMSAKYLGQPFDIHAGAIDLVPVHHENEIAESEAAYGKPLANYWVHSEFLLVDDKKMSKSLGNLYLIDDVIKRGINPLAFRYLCLGAHYRSKLNFTWESLKGAESALKSLYKIARGLGRSKIGCTEWEKKFLERINDDLDAPGAIAIMWEMLKSDNPPSAKAKSLLKFDEVLGLGIKSYLGKKIKIPAGVAKLLKEREAARIAKNWKLSDELRDKIAKLGFLIEDTAEGTKVEEK